MKLDNFPKLDIFLISHLHKQHSSPVILLINLIVFQ
uniref:Uncharacterized protein n=1 Tax=Manihot esculenta TaxID=3983 RepID=A0A2C9UGI3_MANES